MTYKGSQKEKDYQIRYRKLNRKDIKEHKKEYYLLNKDKIKKRVSEYQKLYREQRNVYQRKYYRLNKEKKLKANRKYRQSHQELVSQINKNYNQSHREQRKGYDRKRIATPNGRLSNRMGNAMRTALKQNKAGRHWEVLAGYTIDDLIRHLESKFTNGLTWKKFFKEGYHIDHIKPKSLFHYETAEDPEFKECWALENLQPLEKIENLKKSNHY
jgi:hypothetical protein